jgi:hypothetical protein
MISPQALSFYDTKTITHPEAAGNSISAQQWAKECNLYQYRLSHPERVGMRHKRASITQLDAAIASDGARYEITPSSWKQLSTL